MVFVAKLLRNGWADFDKIWCTYRVGLRIGQHLFFIPLNVKGGPPTFLFFHDLALENTYNSKFSHFYNFVSSTNQQNGDRMQ